MPDESSVPCKFYGAYCFDLSPTYNAWIKLTAADVHALQEREGFEWRNSESRREGQTASVYFYLNHPIQWVCLVGVVVAFDVYEHRFIMLLDDSSGANIEVTCGRPQEQNADTKLDAPSTKTIRNAMMGKTTQGNTVDLTGVDVGSVIKIKGSIGTFRGTRQIQLERLWIVRTTNEEASAWSKTATFRRKVLSIPWVLADQEERRAKRKAEGYEAKRKAREEHNRKKAVLDEEARRRAAKRAKLQRLPGEKEQGLAGDHNDGQKPRTRQKPALNPDRERRRRRDVKA
ncbi:MAG: hypothetical protein Q9195_000638 [Heterodermia aff. obscurata]